MGQEQQSVTVDIEEDDDETWQRRKYVNQLFKSWSEAAEALEDMGVERRPETHRIALARLCGLIRVSLPVLRGTDVWDQKKLGAVEIGAETAHGVEMQQKTVAGVKTVLQLEDGIPTYVEREVPGRTNATEIKQGHKRLPRGIIRSAFNAISEEFHDKGIIREKSGEASAKDKEAL